MLNSCPSIFANESIETQIETKKRPIIMIYITIIIHQYESCWLANDRNWVLKLQLLANTQLAAYHKVFAIVMKKAIMTIIMPKIMIMIIF